jgi:hypothetical protein
MLINHVVNLDNLAVKPPPIINTLNNGQFTANKTQI